MTVQDFSEAVAHYCDEEQIENESYFYTVLNGVLLEILKRFPIVKSYIYELKASDSQTVVNMKELVDDFASFSTPAFSAAVNCPTSRPHVDGRLGQLIFGSGPKRNYIIFYNQRIPTVTRDTVDIPLENERLELLILGTAYRLLTIDESYDAAATVKRLYDEAAYTLDIYERQNDMPITDAYGW